MLIWYNRLDHWYIDIRYICNWKSYSKLISNIRQHSHSNVIFDHLWKIYPLVMAFIFTISREMWKLSAINEAFCMSCYTWRIACHISFYVTHTATKSHKFVIAALLWLNVQFVSNFLPDARLMGSNPCAPLVLEMFIYAAFNVHRNSQIYILCPSAISHAVSFCTTKRPLGWILNACYILKPAQSFINPNSCFPDLGGS